jgi:hypothetical protein
MPTAPQSNTCSLGVSISEYSVPLITPSDHTLDAITSLSMECSETWRLRFWVEVTLDAQRHGLLLNWLEQMDRPFLQALVVFWTRTIHHLFDETR